MLAHVRAWCGLFHSLAGIARDCGHHNENRIRWIRFVRTKIDSFFGEFPADSSKQVLFDRFLSFNTRTDPTNLSRRQEANASFRFQFFSADVGHAKAIIHTPTATEDIILSREPPISSKKILMRRISRNWQPPLFPASHSDSSATISLRRPGTTQIDASRSRLKLASDRRHIASDPCDPANLAGKVTANAPRPRTTSAG